MESGTPLFLTDYGSNTVLRCLRVRDYSSFSISTFHFNCCRSRRILVRYFNTYKYRLTGYPSRVSNLNIPGYEVIPVYSTDFNTTESLWFDKIWPRDLSRPSSSCQPHLFSTGESNSSTEVLIIAVSTNQSGFVYTIGQIAQNAEYSVGGAAILYSNSPLQNCTVTSMNFKASGPAFKRPGACVLTVYPPIRSDHRPSSLATTPSMSSCRRPGVGEGNSNCMMLIQ